MAADAERAPRSGARWASLALGVLLLGALAAYAVMRGSLDPEPSAPVVWADPPAPPEEPAVLASAVAPLTERQRGAQQRYLSGVIHFQKRDYAKAAKDWDEAARLDPANEDVKAAQRRLGAERGKER